MEVACLGRPFHLGLLYNCHRDQLVGGECFWDSVILDEYTKSSPQKSSGEYKILSENTTKAKGKMLEIGDNLLLSFMAGLVSVNGSAKFLYDELATSKIQRVALFLKCTDRSDQLQVEELGSFPSSDMVKDTGATHIVTGINFGLSAFFVFDKTSEDILDSKSALELKTEMEAVIKSIPRKLATAAEKAKMVELKCTLHSDITGKKNPNTWDEAVKVYEELTKLAMTVPIKAQLEPLSKYNNESGCVPVSIISKKVAIEFVQMFEHLQTVNFDSIHMHESYPACSYFKGLGKQLNQFQQMLKQYMAKSAKFLEETLPKVRSGVLKEDDIANFVKLTSTSPFGATQVSSWLDAKEQEVHHLTGKLDALQEIDFAFATNYFFKVINSDDYEGVLCLDISLTDQDSSLISMLGYLSEKTCICEPEIPWYKDRDKMKHLHDMIKHFKGFAKANRENKHMKCIVSSRSEEGKHCVKIDHYEYGLAKEFLPPGPPSKLEACNVTLSSIELTWAEPTIGATNVETYCVSYKPSECLADKWHDVDTEDATRCLMIDNLQPATCYEFKVRAVCAAGCSQGSGIKSVKTVTTFQSSNSVTSENGGEICTTALSPIEFRHPTISKVSQNGAVVAWTNPTGAVVEKYSIYYKCVSQLTEEWHLCGTTHGREQQATISCLDSGKEYYFKVSASCMNGDKIERETLTSCITTSIVYLDPPVVVKVSDHEVSLTLAEPHGAQEDVQEYFVMYTLLDESLEESSGWKSSTATIDSAQKQATVTGLRSDSTYIFKAMAIFYSRKSVESKPSNHAKTRHAESKIIKPNVSRVTYNSVSLTWSKPIGITVDHYMLYKKEHSGVWCSCGSVDGSQEETCITRLNSATLYVFKFRAFSTDQKVIDSDETDECKTDIQFNKPTISGQTCSSVFISWSKPQCMSERVHKYSICYSLPTQHPKQWILSKEVEGMTEETTVAGLMHNSSYVFQVTAFYYSGKNATSDVSDEAQTLSKPKMAKPVVCGVTKSSASLKWSTPKELHVHHFTVTYQSFPTSSEEWELGGSVRKTDTQMTVKDLVPGTAYKFKVNAVCHNGEMIESEASDVCETKHIIIFKKPKVSNLTENGAFLQWSKPDGARVNVQSYSVSYSVCTDASKPHDWTENPEIINSWIQAKEIGGLKSNSFYVFKIRVVYEHGSFVDSEPSDQVQTLQKIEIQPPVVSSITSNSVSLKWMRPDRVEIKYYSILSRNLSKDSEEWHPCGTGKECEQETIIKELNPNTEYVFRIDAATKMDGRIIESQPSAKCKTKQSLHLNKPNIVNVTCRTVTLGWSKPEGVTETVQEYSVEYCLVSNPVETWEQFEEVENGSVREITVTGLCANSAYIFRVNAVFGSRKCVTSDASDEILTNSYLLKRPHISDITENCVQLKLTKPKESVISQYVIMYRATSDSSDTCYTVAGNQDRITISQLNPGTKYHVKVIAHCEDGAKVESPVSECETQRLVSLNKPRCSNPREHAITLQWTKPDDYEAKRIQEYYIAFQPPSAPNEEWTKQLIVGTTDSIPIAGLKAYTVYKFKIIALLHSGKEIESPSSECIQTKPPSTLAKPTISSITNHSVLITWSKPEGVCVDKYTIHYRAKGIVKWWHECGTAPGTDENFHVQKLSPDTGHYFKVIAYYENGKKIETEISDCCYTKRTLILLPPLMTHKTDHSVSLEWFKPSGADENEYQVSKYEVRYCQVDDPEERWISQATNSFNLKTTVFHLSPNKEYVFDVIAIMISNDRVQSKTTKPVITEPPCRPGPPRAKKSSITEQNIHISWAKPTSGREAVTSYSVIYWKADDHPHNELSVDCNSTADGKVVDGLEPQTSYTFKIRANRNVGKSYESKEVTYQTEGPCGVLDPQLECCTDHTATISWSKLDSWSRIRCFEISYKPVALHPQKPTEWTRVKTATPDELSMKLGKLSPATMYEYVVHALLEADNWGKMFAKGTFKTHDPCCPGKPVSLTLTNNSVTIQWSKPAYHYARIRDYTVFYQVSDNTKWKLKKLNSVTEKATIDDLRSSTVYYFVIKPETDDPDLGVFSERSEPIQTKDECRPGKPEILTVRDTSVQLKWAAPEYGSSEVEHYKIYYHCLTDSENNWEAFKQVVYTHNNRMVTVTNLHPKTDYIFKVRASSKGNLVCVDSYPSSPTSTKSEPPAQQLLRKSTLVREKNPAIYQLKMNIVPLDGNEKLRKCEIGTKDRANPGKEKVLLLVGATGSGKSTLVNGITNYILGVSWQHNFRFQLIGDEGRLSQAHSQTQSVTAYTFHKMEGSQLDYTLTIVDTPGFGDTRGVEQDETIVNLIGEFFSKPGGITFLNGIGFVAQATLPRLTPTQKYIFDKVLGIFGKDVINSISIMATFADGQDPPLYVALDEANLPIHEKYPFNNSGLYAGQDNPCAFFFFEMGGASFTHFFDQFQNAEDISLMQTKDVLAERRRLEATTQSLQEQVHEVLCKMDELRQLEQILEGHKTQIEQNKDFTFQVTEPKQSKVDLPTGIHTTNCLVCNRTCHENCSYAKDSDKYKCCAMGHDGMCHNCPNHCHWRKHVNNPYKFVLEEVTVVKTSKDLEAKYHTAKSNKSKSEDMIINVKSEYDSRVQQAQDLVNQVRHCLEHLAAIALRPDPLTEEEYIDLLIETEKLEKKPRWIERVTSYERLKQRKGIIIKIKDGRDIFKK